MADVNEANINVVCSWRMPVGDLNGKVISLEEATEAASEMKSSMVPGLDGCPIMFKQRWYDSVRMASLTVERKF